MGGAASCQSESQLLKQQQQQQQHQNWTDAWEAKRKAAGAPVEGSGLDPACRPWSSASRACLPHPLPSLEEASP